MLRTQIFEKKANSPVTVKNCFWPVFSRNLEGDKPQGPIFEYPQAVLTITLEVKGIILWQLRSCWKHKFLKKRQTFQWKKNFGQFFLPLSSVTNLRRLFLSIHKIFWQILWKLQVHFCNTYEVVENTSFGKKTQTFQWRKDFGLFFLAFSSVTNLRGQFMSIHKVFWQLLWKLQDPYCNT